MKLKNVVLSALCLLLLQALAFSQEDTYRGEKLYQLKCGRCHFVYPPEKYSGEEWKTVVKEMASQAGLTAETERTILEYLSQRASQKDRSVFPTSPVIAGYLYTEFFSAKDIVDTFDIHYLNVSITGRIHERVSYRTEFEFEHGGAQDEPPFVEQAYLDVWLLKNTGLRIGAILTPFNRFDEFHGPLENLLVTRPQMSNEIGVSAWKEVGVNLHGSFSFTRNFYMTYDAYMINGLGSGSRLRKSRHYLDNNDAKSLGFRLSGVIADRWEAGASYYRGAWDDAGNLDLSMYGFHLLGKVGGLGLFAEYAHSLSENPQPYEAGKADGFFIQVSYLFGRKFRSMLRYGTLDYLDRGGLLGRTPTDYDNKIWALCLNYYLTPAVVFKMEYDLIQEGTRLPSKDNNLLALQAAVRF